VVRVLVDKSSSMGKKQYWWGNPNPTRDERSMNLLSQLSIDIHRLAEMKQKYLLKLNFQVLTFGPNVPSATKLSVDEVKRIPVSHIPGTKLCDTLSNEHINISKLTNINSKFIVIVLTDGDDTTSTPEHRERLSSYFKENSGMMFGFWVGIDSNSSAQADELSFQYMTLDDPKNTSESITTQLEVILEHLLIKEIVYYN